VEGHPPHVRGRAGPQGAAAIDIRTLVGTLDIDTLIRVRDRALLVIGFAGAFRRSELVALDAEDVYWERRRAGRLHQA
jgi:site-specific recombinase XerC